MVNLKHCTNLMGRNSGHVQVNASRKSLSGNEDSYSQRIPNGIKYKTACWRCGVILVMFAKFKKEFGYDVVNVVMLKYVVKVSQKLPTVSTSSVK